MNFYCFSKGLVFVLLAINLDNRLSLLLADKLLARRKHISSEKTTSNIVYGCFSACILHVPMFARYWRSFWHLVHRGEIGLSKTRERLLYLAQICYANSIHITLQQFVEECICNQHCCFSIMCSVKWLVMFQGEGIVVRGVSRRVPVFKNFCTQFTQLLVVVFFLCVHRESVIHSDKFSHSCFFHLESVIHSDKVSHCCLKK